MKSVLVLVLVLINTSCFSQDLESIKKSDTIYIYFNHGKHEKYSNIGGTLDEKKIITYLYQYYLDKENFINFISRNYRDFDDLLIGKKTDVKTVRKNFLRKNKEKILDIDFFINNGFDKVFSILYTTQKKIYIIDSKEIKGRNVILKEVTMDAPNFTPE